MDEIMDELAEQTRSEEVEAEEEPAARDVPEEREEVREDPPASAEEESELLRQAKALVEHFPELQGKEAPEEVIRAAMEGEDLTAAYTRYALAQSRAERERLEKELSARRQSEEAASRAPVQGVSGGPSVGEQGSDPFLAGFLED